MTEPADTERLPVWGKCPECGHCWPVAYAPQSLEKFAKIMKSHSTCPMCGAAGVVAKQSAGVLLEPDSGADR